MVDMDCRRGNLLATWGISLGLGVMAMTTETSATTTTLTPTPLVALKPTQECDRCTGTLLPGRVRPHPETRWGIISDLPESFRGFGTLYSTRQRLPDNGADPGMLSQTSSVGFQGIDNNFDVFWFHLNKEAGHATRIVVLARNRGESRVEIRPFQVVKTEGIIATIHEFENTLTKRTMARLWDETTLSADGNYPEITFGDQPAPNQVAPVIAIPPGQARVVAYSRQFGDVQNSEDSSRNVNCFGYGRFFVQSSVAPNLEISVIAIPAGPRSELNSQALAWEDKGAESTDEVPMSGYPRGCALGRAVGTYDNYVWVSDTLVMDGSRINADGTSFPMALPRIQSLGCPEARQTGDLVLRPGYTREDNIGNYMIEHEARWVLFNPEESTGPLALDLRLGGPMADIGLAYALARTPVDFEGNPFATATLQALWAGPKQVARQRSLMAEPLVLQPGESTMVHLRYMIVPNSSLPFLLGWHRVDRIDPGR